MRVPYAGGGKLSAKDVATIRAGGTIDVDVSLRQVQRVRCGDAWADGWVPPKADDRDDFKVCAVCGATYTRRFANGRRRSDTVWGQKVTCGNACNTKKRWQDGGYKGRTAAKKP